VLELEHRLRVEGGGIVEMRLLGVFIRRAAFDHIDPANRSTARIGFDHQPRAQIEFPNHLPWNDVPAAQWAKGKHRVAELAILALVGDVEDSFQLSLVHSFGPDSEKVARRSMSASTSNGCAKTVQL